jgi:hypothetical protein
MSVKGKYSRNSNDTVTCRERRCPGAMRTPADQAAGETGHLRDVVAWKQPGTDAAEKHGAQEQEVDVPGDRTERTEVRIKDPLEEETDGAYAAEQVSQQGQNRDSLSQRPHSQGIQPGRQEHGVDRQPER